MCAPYPGMGRHPHSRYPHQSSSTPGSPWDWTLICGLIAVLIAITAFVAFGVGYGSGAVDRLKREVRECLRHEDRQITRRYGGVVRIENVCVEWRITR